MKILIASILLVTNIFALEDGSLSATKEQKLAVVLINGKSSNGETRATGFACSYKNNEFIATNLHVIEGVESISIRPQSGNKIRLSGKVIVAEDADICLLGIVGEFKDFGITPLDFMDDVFAGSKVDDKILCLGNALGGGVITTTTGTIKAFGQPRIEIVSPVVQGNSGGPIIHGKTGKVVGLVTEAVINDTESDKLTRAASASRGSGIREISYFGHRVDAVRKWKGTSFQDYSKSSNIIISSELGINRTLMFFAGEDGWKEDLRLAGAWKIYRKFIDESSAKTTRRKVSRYNYYNGFSGYSNSYRQRFGSRGQSIAQADYDKARATFCRSVEWKIKSDQEALVRVKPLGYRQIKKTKVLLGVSKKALELQQGFTLP